MGQKINPTSYRLIQDKNWKSKWFNQHNLGLLLTEDLEIKKKIHLLLAHVGGLETIEIKRAAQEIIVIIYTSKPGLIIGRSGGGITELKKKLELTIENFRDKLPYHLKNKTILKSLPTKIKLEIIEARTPELSASLIAEQIASRLTKRVAYRRVAHQAIEKSIEKGAKGIKIVMSGRLGGVEIARTETFSQGVVPLSTIRADIGYSHFDALTTYGTIGIKVWLYRGLKKA